MISIIVLEECILLRINSTTGNASAPRYLLIEGETMIDVLVLATVLWHIVERYKPIIVGTEELVKEGLPPEMEFVKLL